MGCGASHKAAADGFTASPIPSNGGAPSQADTGGSSEVFVYAGVFDEGYEPNGAKPNKDASESDSLLVRIRQA